MKRASDNGLEAKGVLLAKGSKVVAALTPTPHKAVTVRFTVKQGLPDDAKPA